MTHATQTQGKKTMKRPTDKNGLQNYYLELCFQFEREPQEIVARLTIKQLTTACRNLEHGLQDCPNGDVIVNVARFNAAFSPLDTLRHREPAQ